MDRILYIAIWVIGTAIFSRDLGRSATQVYHFKRFQYWMEIGIAVLWPAIFGIVAAIGIFICAWDALRSLASFLRKLLPSKP